MYLVRVTGIDYVVQLTNTIDFQQKALAICGHDDHWYSNNFRACICKKLIISSIIEPSLVTVVFDFLRNKFTSEEIEMAKSSLYIHLASEPINDVGMVFPPSGMHFRVKLEHILKHPKIEDARQHLLSSKF